MYQVIIPRRGVYMLEENSISVPGTSEAAPNPGVEHVPDSVVAVGTALPTLVALVIIARSFAVKLSKLLTTISMGIEVLNTVMSRESDKVSRLAGTVSAIRSDIQEAVSTGPVTVETRGDEAATDTVEPPKPPNPGSAATAAVEPPNPGNMPT